MFGHQNNSEVKYAHDYFSAKSRYDSVKPWRGGYNNERPAGDRKHKHKVIRMLSDGSIAYRFHRTDVVIFRPGNTLELCTTWPTKTTQEFMAACLEGPISIRLNPAPVVWVRARYGDGYNGLRGFLIEDSYAIIKDREVINAAPIKVPSIDAKLSRPLREAAGLPQYVMWYNAYKAFKKTGKHKPFESNHLGHWTRDEALEVLQSRDPAQYAELAEQYSVSSLTRFIYEDHLSDIVKYKTKEWFDNESDVAAWMSQRRKLRA